MSSTCWVCSGTSVRVVSDDGRVESIPKGGGRSDSSSFVVSLGSVDASVINTCSRAGVSSSLKYSC